MRRRIWPWIVGLTLLVPVVGLALLLLPLGSAENSGDQVPPTFDERFWQTWGDGRAELAGYDLSYSRYGEIRRGTAVTIFVTETFAGAVGVKHEDPDRPDDQAYPVMKLNLMQDFPTGIYDYHLMTSAFVALSESDFSRQGHATKIAFSSQEWCGQAYAQLRFDPDSVRFQSHSYLDGEGDRQDSLELPANGLAEDVLLLWARGMAAPRLEPGKMRQVRLLRSLELTRLGHVAPAWETAILRRSAAVQSITVPAGTYEVDRFEVTVEASRTRRTYPPDTDDVALPGRQWTFFVERGPSRRIVRWERSDGTTAELLADTRLPYWTLNGNGFEAELGKLGLLPRPARTQ